MVKLFAFLRRSPDMSYDEFVEHWRDHHGPLIIAVSGPHDPTRQGGRKMAGWQSDIISRDPLQLTARVRHALLATVSG